MEEITFQTGQVGKEVKLQGFLSTRGKIAQGKGFLIHKEGEEVKLQVFLSTGGKKRSSYRV